MKILHYALGFPPYRTGGLTKFNIDLMCQQHKMGHQVALLWPGQMSVIRRNTSVKKRKAVTIDGATIDSFEVINPLPVPYDEGISDIAEFVKDVNEEIYVKLLKDYKPDVVHVHTLMGIHKSFLTSIKKCGIHLVFTAHDFFPICPKVTMFREGRICPNIEFCDDCGMCNTSALSINKIKILQSPLYRMLKDTCFVKKIRKGHRDSYLSENKIDRKVEPVGSAEDFQELRRYFYSLLKLMDVIHYNSSLTQNIYERYFELSNSYMINISHSDIEDNRKLKEFDSPVLRIRYLGPASGAKGFYVLKKSLDQVWKKRKDFRLDVHFMYQDSVPYMKCNRRYQYNELEKIFDNTDILVAPSVWYETFGYTVLEALSYGVPVIISGTVGAKDILEEGAGIIIERCSIEELCNTILELDFIKLKNMNHVILQKQDIKTIADMAQEIEQYCYH